MQSHWNDLGGPLYIKKKKTSDSKNSKLHKCQLVLSSPDQRSKKSFVAISQNSVSNFQTGPYMILNVFKCRFCTAEEMKCCLQSDSMPSGKSSLKEGHLVSCADTCLSDSACIKVTLIQLSSKKFTHTQDSETLSLTCSFHLKLALWAVHTLLQRTCFAAPSLLLKYPFFVDVLPVLPPCFWLVRKVYVMHWPHAVMNSTITWFFRRCGSVAKAGC